MIVSFRDAESEAIYDDERSKAARRRLPLVLWSVAQRKLSQLNAVESLQDLAVPPGNRLEELRGNRRGKHSIRINVQYRICFAWTPEGPFDMEIVDYR
jgi:proteic killer suppression protein